MVQLKDVLTIPPDELQVLANNKGIAANLKDSFPHPYTIEDAGEFMNLAAQHKLGHIFGIFYNDIFTGVCSINVKDDIYSNNGELGYWIGEPFQRKGYATAAVRLLTEYAYRELDITRIYAGVFQNNIASMKTLEKNGYQQEAVLKASVTKFGKTLDEHIYSRIFSRPDFRTNQL